LPKFDPHGDPIPDADGNFAQRSQVLLSEMKPGDKGAIVGVNDHTPGFLQYLDRMQLILGTQVEILEYFEYDESVRVIIGTDREQLLTKKVSQHLFVQKDAG
jgi:DtxR family Mn-dependent transcriptional regulator